MRNILIGCDRDGVLIHNHKTKENGNFFNKSNNDLDVIPDVSRGLNLLSGYDVSLYIITNQAWLLEGDVDSNYSMCHEAQKALIKRLGNGIIKGYRITTIDSEFMKRSQAKADIMKELIKQYNSYERWFIGDSKSDIDAGNMSGCTTIQVKPKFDCSDDLKADSDYIVDSFYDACRIIESDGIITIKRKPIEFNPVTIKVVNKETFYTDMAGEHVIPVGDIMVIHSDGSISGMRRDSYQTLYNRENLL